MWLLVHSVDIITEADKQHFHLNRKVCFSSKTFLGKIIRTIRFACNPHKKRTFFFVSWLNSLSFCLFVCLLFICSMCIFGCLVFNQYPKPFHFILAGYQPGIRAFVVLCNAPCGMDSGNSGDNRANCYTNCTYAGSMVLLAKLRSIRWPPNGKLQ